jgi:hypothetical protein
MLKVELRHSNCTNAKPILYSPDRNFPMTDLLRSVYASKIGVSKEGSVSLNNGSMIGLKEIYVEKYLSKF